MATIAVSRSEAAQVARDTNAQIKAMAQSLDSIAPNERPIGFFCECGCLGFAEVTLDEFEAAGGAWLEGHKADLAA